MSESVELATILLTDLVGSTRLATAVGPVRADQLRDEHFAVLREAIQTAGGREFKNTGDGLMVAFGSASAAVRCAVSMQQLFERRYRKAEQKLHIRIGLGAGESTVQDGDYFGMPSIEAARLCDIAPSDGILVSSLVKSLAGRVGGVAFESVGDLELKGFTEAVEAFAVPWLALGAEGESAGAWPLPPVLRSVPVLAYVGREPERAIIDHAQSDARDGARQVVLLSGEPGIGKSRLAAYAAQGAHGDGCAITWGACSEDLGVPYEPWIEVCSQLVEHAPPELLERYASRHGGELSRLARDLARRVADLPAPQTSDSETERFLLFSAVAGLLTEIARSLPVVVVLDDFHWADGQSVALLKHVARAAEHSALLLIVTYRESDLGKDNPLSGLLADLHRVPGVERIPLRGLGGDEVAQILTAAAGHELDEDGLVLSGEIAAETGGNPFFVGEVLRSLLESGRVLYDEQTGRWSVDRSTTIGLPQSVREVIEHRVERLGDETRKVLRVAAVIGRSFDVELLARLVEIGEARLLDHLEAAVAASLLDESTEQVGRFRFVHALINQTLYEALGATRRARIHHAVGEALEELYGPGSDEHLGELALHWRLATVAVDKPKAAAYAARAGHRALDGLAPAEAARLFGDAVELLGAGDTVERCEALVGLGEAQRLTGNAAFRETLLEASRIASVLENGELATDAALANIRGLTTVIGDTDHEHLSTIERALELDDRSDPARRGRLLAVQALELSYNPAEAAHRRLLAEEAVALARESANPAALAGVLRDAILATQSPDTLTERLDMTDELGRAAGQAQDPALEFWAADLGWTISSERGEFDRATEALRRMQRLAEELGQPTLRWLACASTTAHELRRGHLADAERLAERAAQLGQDGDPVNAALYYGAHLAFIRVFQGRGEEVLPMMEQSVAAYPGIPAWRAGLAHVCCWTGSFDKCGAIVREAAADRFEHIPWDAVRMTALALYAESAAQSGCAEAAAILYELLEPWWDQIACSGALNYGHVRMYLGELADTAGWPERAEEHLEFACQFHDQHGMRLCAANSHLAWASSLARRGDGARARKHGAQALELARANGYGEIDRRAAVLVGPEVSAEM